MIYPTANSCKENEEYSECGPCEKTCDERQPLCTTGCVKGCFCVKGFVRDSNGKCIHPSLCREFKISYIV